jgi:peptide/nickel transport system substrate-binding protein
VRVIIDSEPGHLNPVWDPDLWGYRLAHDLICEPLWRLKPGAGPGPGDEPAFEGVLAERFTVDSDGTGATVTLRRGVRFHDGKPLTAHDVRYTLERLHTATKTAPRSQALAADLKEVTVGSAERLRIDLWRPSGRLLQDLAEIDILPEHVFGEGGLAQRGPSRRPVCSGPYRLAEWRHGGDRQPGEIVLRRNPTYWGPPPPAEELRFLIVPDMSRGLALLRRGGAEVLADLPPLYVPDQVEPAMLRGRLTRQEAPASQVLLVLWNGRHPLLSQPQVRRALSLLFDRRRLVRDVRHGLGEPRHLPPPLPEPAAPPPGMAEAEALLDAAGLPRQAPNGPRRSAGRPVQLQLLCPAGSSEAAHVARLLGEALSAAGVGLKTELLDLAALQGRLRRGAFDAALMAWAWTGPEPDLKPLLHSRGAQALSRSETPELDAALDTLHRAVGPYRGDRRQAAMAQVAALLSAHQPVTFLYRPRHLMLLDIRLAPAPLPMQNGFLFLRALHPIIGPANK